MREETRRYLREQDPDGEGARRVEQFFATTPEPEGDLDDIIAQAQWEAAARMDPTLRTPNLEQSTLKGAATVFPVTVNDNDWDYLYDQAHVWAGRASWTQQIQDGRFAVASDLDQPVTQRHAFIYFFSEYTEVILARSYLEHKHGTDLQVLSDEAGGWAITTDYADQHTAQLLQYE